MDREHLENWIKENLAKLTNGQLESAANYIESAIYENKYKDYI